MKKLKDIVVIGVALFAMFFGAGNLIFPPQLGVMSGDSWLQAILGFFTTDVSLSIMSGADLNAGAIMLIIGPLLALPRTGAVSYEMGILPILPGIPQYIFTLIYFGTSLLFVVNAKVLSTK